MMALITALAIIRPSPDSMIGDLRSDAIVEVSAAHIPILKIPTSNITAALRRYGSMLTMSGLFMMLVLIIASVKQVWAPVIDCGKGVFSCGRPMPRDI